MCVYLFCWKCSIVCLSYILVAITCAPFPLMQRGVIAALLATNKELKSQLKKLNTPRRDGSGTPTADNSAALGLAVLKSKLELRVCVHDGCVCVVWRDFMSVCFCF